MRREAAAFALTGLLTLLTGCGDLLPEGREVEDMVLLQTLGVDLEGGAVAVRAREGTREDGEGDLYGAEGENIAAACLKMQKAGEAYLFLGHVENVILGEEYAGGRLEEVLEYVERDIEMRLDTGLFVVKGGRAEDVLKGAGEGDLTARLERLGETLTRRTVKDVAAGGLRDGASYAPALAVGEEGLLPAGYALFLDNRLVGYAEGEAACGVDLLSGRAKADLVSVEWRGESYGLRVTGAESRILPRFTEGVLTGLEVHCRVRANVAQAPGPLDGDAPEGLAEALEEIEGRRIGEALALFRRLKGDFLGLGTQAALLRPWEKGVLEQEWRASFGELESLVTVEARLERSYDVK